MGGGSSKPHGHHGSVASGMQTQMTVQQSMDLAAGRKTAYEIDQENLDRAVPCGDNNNNQQGGCVSNLANPDSDLSKSHQHQEETEEHKAWANEVAYLHTYSGQIGFNQITGVSEHNVDEWIANNPEPEPYADVWDTDAAGELFQEQARHQRFESGRETAADRIHVAQNVCPMTGVLKEVGCTVLWDGADVMDFIPILGTITRAERMALMAAAGEDEAVDEEAFIFGLDIASDIIPEVASLKRLKAAKLAVQSRLATATGSVSVSLRKALTRITESERIAAEAESVTPHHIPPGRDSLVDTGRVTDNTLTQDTGRVIDTPTDVAVPTVQPSAVESVAVESVVDDAPKTIHKNHHHKNKHKKEHHRHAVINSGASRGEDMGHAASTAAGVAVHSGAGGAVTHMVPKAVEDAGLHATVSGGVSAGEQAALKETAHATESAAVHEETHAAHIHNERAAVEKPKPWRRTRQAVGTVAVAGTGVAVGVGSWAATHPAAAAMLGANIAGAIDGLLHPTPKSEQRRNQYRSDRDPLYAILHNMCRGVFMFTSAGGTDSCTWVKFVSPLILTLTTFSFTPRGMSTGGRLGLGIAVGGSYYVWKEGVFVDFKDNEEEHEVEPDISSVTEPDIDEPKHHHHRHNRHNRHSSN